MEEEDIKPGLTSGIKRFKNSIKRNAIKVKVKGISGLQIGGDAVKTGVNKVYNSRPVKFVRKKKNDIVQGVTAVKDAVVDTVTDVRDTIVDGVNDAIDNSKLVTHEKERMQHRQQVFDKEKQRLLNTDDKFLNRTELSRKRALQERLKNNGNGGNNGAW